VAQAAAAKLTPTVLELGGKSPVLVDKSANLRIAARRIAWGAFLNAGQSCVRPDYILAHEDIAERLMRLLRKFTVRMFTDKPQRSDFYGRIM